MRFTQRQAGGRFTREEVASFIAQLEAGRDGTGGPDASITPTPDRLTQADRAIRRISTADLAAELQRRGWIVVEP